MHNEFSDVGFCVCQFDPPLTMRIKTHVEAFTVHLGFLGSFNPNANP